MKLSDYDYHLPPDLIAQYPLPRRSDSRLLVVERAPDGGAPRVSHRRFRDLPELLDPGDLLVFNRTRVFKARLVGRLSSGREAELLLLRRAGPGRWEAMVRPGKKVKPGSAVTFADGELRAEIEMSTASGQRIVSFSASDGSDPETLIGNIGQVPLPPYIRRAPDARDESRYQTVFARETGAVAAPTAGLHFSRGLLKRLDEAGIGRAELVLHVGPGTFRPITVDDPRRHVMDPEEYMVPRATIEAVTRTRERGGRVTAVGTTSVRALESIARSKASRNGDGPAAGRTDLFVYPPFEFRLVDSLLTNFHLPRSSLLLLVSAFLGREATLDIYRQAVERRYRFYSYGDAMLIV